MMAILTGVKWYLIHTHTHTHAHTHMYIYTYKPVCIYTHSHIHNGILLSHIYNVWYTYIYNGILLSHKKNGIIPFAMTWVGLEIIKFSEGSQRQISHDVTYVWILKKRYKWTYLDNRLTDIENKQGKAVGGKIRSLEINRYTLLYIK